MKSTGWDKIEKFYVFVEYFGIVPSKVKLYNENVKPTSQNKNKTEYKNLNKTEEKDYRKTVENLFECLHHFYTSNHSKIM